MKVFKNMLFAFAALPLSLSPPFDWERARDVVDELRYDNLDDMAWYGLESASLKVSPWSDSYWPIYAGGMALRYADPDLPSAGSDWSEFSSYLLRTMGKRPMSELSPAEKYDLLVGDRNFTLSRNMANLGSQYQRNGKVETWMGFCHGWSLASYMMPRPRRSVTVTAVDGTRVEFRPADIKALGTLLWANGAFPRRFTGARCEAQPPGDGRRTGVPACLDVNPVVWHLSVVNQVGYSRRGLTFDGDPDYQVWNYPLLSYSYQYYDPITGDRFRRLRDAIVRRSDYWGDPRGPYRAAGTTQLVGIEMDVTYLNEENPSLSPTDDPSHDELKTVRYRYDLELDDRGRLLGGEWYTRHPDFIWVPPPGAHAVSWADSNIPDDDSWSGVEPLPSYWAGLARRATPSMQPLGHIVETLFRLSQ